MAGGSGRARIICRTGKEEGPGEGATGMTSWRRAPLDLSFAFSFRRDVKEFLFQTDAKRRCEPDFGEIMRTDNKENQNKKNIIPLP